MRYYLSKDAYALLALAGENGAPTRFSLEGVLFSTSPFLERPTQPVFAFRMMLSVEKGTLSRFHRAHRNGGACKEANLKPTRNSSDFGAPKVCCPFGLLTFKRLAQNFWGSLQTPKCAVVSFSKIGDAPRGGCLKQTKGTCEQWSFISFAWRHPNHVLLLGFDPTTWVRVNQGSL